MFWASVFSIVVVSCICAWGVLRLWKSRHLKEHHKAEIVLADLGKPKLPMPIRGFNFFGKFFPCQPLTVDMLVVEAQKRTQLRDCLDEDRYPFRDGLLKLLQDYNETNRLTKFGKLCLKKVFVRMISNNLLIAEQIKNHQEILTETIVNPVFIIGPPRTGSSHLHDTLSQHPVFRTPKHLELLCPVLQERYFTSLDVDPRTHGCDAYLKLAKYVRPYLSLLHEVDSNASEEDIFVTGILFRSIIYGSMFPCKEYMQWFGEVDHTPVYDFLRLSLQVTMFDSVDCLTVFLSSQLLQWQDVQMGRPRKRWLLKSPDHSFSLPSLLKIFPDATIIQTHRDMSAVLPSYLNLVVYIHGICNDMVDLKWTGEWWTAWFEFVLHRFVKDQTSVKGQVIDVLFHDLVSDDLSVVMHILSVLGICVDSETQQQLDKYTTAHRRHSKGRVIYNGSVFGLKRQSIRDRFNTYHETFDLVKNRGKQHHEGK